jgi:DNA polymerase-4
VTGELHAVAVRLFAGLARRGKRIRRVGVRGEQMVPADRTYRQPQLTDPERGWREIEFAMDAAGERFGTAAVQRLALLRRPVGTAAGLNAPVQDRPDDWSPTGS